SRIIVKNLPRYLKEDRLRDHFAAQGEVTDVRLMRTAKGVSRRFAYIGYKTDVAAQKAIGYFNNSFIDTTRIAVELAKSVGMYAIRQREEQQVRANRSATHEQGGAKEAALQPAAAKASQKDSRLSEFLEAMQPRIKSKAWANEDGMVVDARPSAQNRQRGDASDDDDDEEMMTVIPAQASTAHDTGLSNLDYLRSKMVMRTDLDDEDEQAEAEKEAEKETSGGADAAMHDTTQVTDGVRKLDIADAGRTQDESPEEQIMDTGRLFLRNLAYTCTEEDLRPIFEQYGPLAEVQLPIDRETKKSKGFAYITYVLPEHARRAYRMQDGQSLQGRLLHILPAKEKLRAPQTEEILSVKKAREQKRKAQAGNDFNWNTLYMNSDAVMDAIADKLNVSKAEILDPTAENMAVRMALAETQVINDTKGYLEQHGISLDAFNKKERSETVILVKNIPHGTTEEQLRGMFGKFGEIGRVIVPPAQTIAVVEFLEPTEARAAFKQLAYSRFKSSLLYLEKAPFGVFTHGYHESKQAEEARQQQQQRKNDVETLLEAAASSNTDADGTAGSTLFMKNLNFNTTEATLREVFAPVGQLRNVTIRKKKDPKNRGQWLSMGFGFVEFAEEDAASRAMKSLQGFVVDGHALQLKVAQKEGSSDAPKVKAGSTKLIVRNIPFEATRKDIQELFSAYGQLKMVRLPKKFSGGHRGFAFIEFLGKQEAKNAMEHLANTHLYGRHLVIEPAEDVTDLDVMRKRVDEQYSKHILWRCVWY
ncbi:hypothetical protein THASP1DRAFT_19051, partial [Thamnocephalis sphaerospora]